MELPNLWADCFILTTLSAKIRLNSHFASCVFVCGVCVCVADEVGGKGNEICFVLFYFLLLVNKLNCRALHIFI